MIALVGIPVAGAAAFLLKGRDGAAGGRHHWSLTVRLAAGISPSEGISPLLQTWFERVALTSAATSKQGTATDLTKVYKSLNSRLVFEKKQTEITALFAAAAAALAMLAGLLSLLWFSRIL